MDESLADSSHPSSESLADSSHPSRESLADSSLPGCAAASPRRPRPWSRRSDLAPWLTLGLALLATLATVPLIWTPIRLQQYRSVMHPEWHLYLLGAQLLAMLFFLLFGGLPRSWRGWCVLLLSNLWIAALAYLSAMDLLKPAAVYALVVGLRVTILGLWLFVVVGALVTVWKLSNRTRSSSAVSTTGKLWFSALVFLLAAEPSAALLSRMLDNPKRVTLPRALPEPPLGELHVAFVGESTMAGFPYAKFGIPKVVGWQLTQMYPDQKVVLDDLSAVGLNLRTALARLDKLTVRPHLLLLYSGHNEFFYDVEELATDLDTPWERFDGVFEWSPLFRVLDQRISRHIGVQDLEAQGARTLVDRPLASPEACEKRLTRFGEQLEQLASWCERQQIAAVWFVPAGTEADYAPNRSYLSNAATDSQRKEIESIEQEGRSLQESGRWKEAGDKYEEAVDRNPSFAEFHFQLAECLVHEGLANAAAPHYAEALELDGLPVRMPRPWRRKVGEVAHRHAIPLVDTASVLRPHTPSGILDRSVFLDYVHPNLRAYYYLGTSAVDRIERDQLLTRKFGQPRARVGTDFASTIAAAGFTAKDLALAYRRTAEADRWMTRLRFESSRLSQDAQKYEDWSRRLESGQIVPGQASTESLK